MENVWIAFGLTLFAGMSTGIGSVIAFFAPRANYRFLSVATGFSAGVMLYVAFVEIFYRGLDALVKTQGQYWGNWANTGSFFAGILLIAVIDKLIPSAENPHETHSEREIAPLHDPNAPAPNFAAVAANPAGAGPGSHDHRVAGKRLMRTGLVTAAAIAIHNFPEGLATFLAALENPAIGVAIAIAIALHNIPEGISVSVPIYYATGKRRKAFLFSLLSGMAEPLGAMIAYVALRLLAGGNGEAFIPQVMGVMFGCVAGIMVFISLDELLPTSRAYGKGHDSLIGLVSGMAVMAITLLLLQ